MALAFLNDTPETAFRKIERDLLHVNPEAKLAAFKSMTPRMLGEAIERIDARKAELQLECSYGEWLSSEAFIEMQLTRDAIVCLKEYKEGKREEETLVPGFSYYRKVQQFGNDLRGLRCYFRESFTPMWVPWQMDLRAAKAFEVLRHGDDNDFRRIYVEMANGCLDALQNVSIEHLTESGDDALNDIASYCDERWSGPWPWEAPSPYTLRETIEEQNEMNRQTVNEMQSRFNNLLTRLDEADMDKYEVIAAAEEMSSTIEKMVQQIARLGGEGIITLKDQIRVAMGDDAAEQIEDTFIQPVRDAADALSRLRATIDQTVQNLKGADEMGGAAPSGDIGEPAGPGGDLGTPADAMGDDPMADDGMDDPLADEGDALAGDIADASLDGGDGERPLKTM